MLTYPDALARLAALALTPTTERLPLAEAAGRVIAEDISLSGDQPPFDRATMDGYALCLKPEQRKPHQRKPSTDQQIPLRQPK